MAISQFSCSHYDVIVSYINGNFGTMERGYPYLSPSVLIIQVATTPLRKIEKPSGEQGLIGIEAILILHNDLQESNDLKLDNILTFSFPLFSCI